MCRFKIDLNTFFVLAQQKDGGVFKAVVGRGTSSSSSSSSWKRGKL
jgi:hypothetical protein